MNGSPDELHEITPELASLSGFVVRGYAGEQDLPAMAEVLNASRAADGVEQVTTGTEMEAAYLPAPGFDPYRNVILVEAGGRLVGYTRFRFEEELDGTEIYWHLRALLPEWRDPAVERALLRHNEAGLRKLAAQRPAGARRLFRTFTFDRGVALEALLRREGYQAVRTELKMVRPGLENLPHAPLPEGLDVRPVQPEHMRAIWEAETEAFRDHWGATVVTEGAFERWLEQNRRDPGLWRVAWDGNQVAGQVRSFIKQEENARYGRRRGYTEDISVRRPWRRRGLARALVVLSLRALQEQGMTEAALTVDSDNPTGALRVYEWCGFQAVGAEITFEKPVEI